MRLEDHIALISRFAAGAASASDLAPLLDAGADVGRRPLIYRNSGMLARVDALRSNYRRLHRLMEEDRFSAMARGYSDLHPPTGRSLVGYGVHLPDMIDASINEHGLGWLGDFARLDRAWLAAHLAADTAVLDASFLAEQGIAPDDMLALRLRLHPSVQIVSTPWALFETWRSDAGALASTTPVAARAGEVSLFWRYADEVQARALSAPEAAFLEACSAGRSLGAASAAALDADADADVSALFAAVLSAGVFMSAQTARSE